MKYKLNRSIIVYQDTENDTLNIIATDGNVFKVSDYPDLFLKILKQIDGSLETEELREGLQLDGYEIDDDSLSILLEELKNHHIITNEPDVYSGKILDDFDLKKFDRQLGWFTIQGLSWESAYRTQERIKQQHVMIIGVGGVGGHVAYALTAMGIGTITIVDFDHVEVSNTSRQLLYSEKNIGERKIDITSKKLREYSSSVRINSHNLLIDTKAKLDELISTEQPDFLFLCADIPRGDIQYWVDEICNNHKTPFIISNPTTGPIAVGPLVVPGRTKSYNELVPRKIDLRHNSDFTAINSYFVSDIIEPLNALAANFGALEYIKYLTDELECSTSGRTALFNCNNFEMKWVDLSD